MIAAGWRFAVRMDGDWPDGEAKKNVNKLTIPFPFCVIHQDIVVAVVVPSCHQASEFLFLDLDPSRPQIADNRLAALPPFVSRKKHKKKRKIEM